MINSTNCFSSKCLMVLIITIGFNSLAYAGDKVVRASDILSGTVTDGFQLAGNVTDALLSEDRNSLQYIFYDVYQPFEAYPSESGYVAMNNVEFERTWNPGDLDIRFKEEDNQGPEEIQVTRAMGDDRLISNIMAEPVLFADGEMRPIKDIRINETTGKVIEYVIETTPDTLFVDELRVIPANKIAISEEGQVTSSVKLENVVGEMQFMPDYG